MSLSKNRYNRIYESMKELQEDGHNNFKENTIKYLQEAFNKGCKVGSHINGLDVFIEGKDYIGKPIMFFQGLYNDPRNNTFMHFYGEDINREDSFNRCSECSGIDIWDFDNLLSAGMVCGKCHKRVKDRSQLRWVMYADLECDDCTNSSWEYINSKPSGYWTS